LLHAAEKSRLYFDQSASFVFGDFGSDFASLRPCSAGFCASQCGFTV
jgi:hypothetical protein